MTVNVALTHTVGLDGPDSDAAWSTSAFPSRVAQRNDDISMEMRMPDVGARFVENGDDVRVWMAE
nr:hypothetical protein [Acidimicrobiia bacterium]